MRYNSSMDIADRLEELMKAHGMDIGALAVASDISYDGIYKILHRQRRNPTVETLRKLAHAMHEPLSALTGDGDELCRETSPGYIVDGSSLTINLSADQLSRVFRASVNRNETPSQVMNAVIDAGLSAIGY